MRKIFYLAMMLTACCFNWALGQYVTDFQAVYPFYKGLNSTKNYTLTKDISLIFDAMPGYMLMTNSAISSTNTALAALKLDINFNVTLTRSYLPSSSVNSKSLIAMDVIATLKGGYVTCGSVTYNKSTYAFMAEFDKNASPLWYKEYPGITTLNAVIEVTNATTDKINYIACGTYNVENYATGIILGVDPSGNPVWQNNTKSNGKSDKFVYNDIIPLNIPDVKLPVFAVVGNSITQPYSDKDVLLTRIDLNGTMQYSYLYGLKNDSSTVYDEEGYGLVLSPKNQIVITGRTKCNYAQLPAIRWDDALLFAVDLNGNPKWAYRYDIPKNSANGEYAQKVIVFNERLNVSGYYRGYVFQGNGSYDAFLFETYLDGAPIQVRVYGDTGDDLFYAQEVNLAKDGLVSAGFTSSFINSPKAAPTYAPYVVESYQSIKEPCHSQAFKLPYEKMPLKMDKIDSYMSSTKYTDNKLTDVKNPASETIICPKKSLVSDTGAVIKSESADIDTPDEILRLYPNPVKNELFIDGSTNGSSYKIYNNIGKLVKQGPINTPSISVMDLEKGLYFITIFNQKESLTVKLVKE